MAQTIDYSLISNPELLDIVDEEWMRDTMPDDSESLQGCTGRAPHYYCSGHKAARTGGLHEASLAGWALLHPQHVLTVHLVRCAGIPLPEGVSPPSDDLDAADDAKENGKVEKWHELALVVPR